MGKKVMRMLANHLLSKSNCPKKKTPGIVTLICIWVSRLTYASIPTAKRIFSPKKNGQVANAKKASVCMTRPLFRITPHLCFWSAPNACEVRESWAQLTPLSADCTIMLQHVADKPTTAIWTGSSMWPAKTLLIIVVLPRVLLIMIGMHIWKKVSSI